MKKTNRMIAGVLAAVMGLASLPVLSASAAEAAYVQGDVDLDGVITGHDSAVVSRSLYVEGASLTEEQAKIADMDGDGVIDQTDLEAIHAKEVYKIGDFTMQKEGTAQTSCMDAFFSLLFYSRKAMGYSVNVISSVNAVENNQIDWDEEKQIDINAVRYNLMDSTGDGIIDCNDAYHTVIAASLEAVGADFYSSGMGENNIRYDLCFETASKDREVAYMENMVEEGVENEQA